MGLPSASHPPQQGVEGETPALLVVKIWVCCIEIVVMTSNLDVYHCSFTVILYHTSGSVGHMGVGRWVTLDTAVLLRYSRRYGRGLHPTRGGKQTMKRAELRLVYFFEIFSPRGTDSPDWMELSEGDFLH